mgnify:FL=1
MFHITCRHLSGEEVHKLQLVLDKIQLPAKGTYEDAEDDADEIPMDKSLALVPLTGGVTCACTSVRDSENVKSASAIFKNIMATADVSPRHSGPKRNELDDDNLLEDAGGFVSKELAGKGEKGKGNKGKCN